MLPIPTMLVNFKLWSYKDRVLDRWRYDEANMVKGIGGDIPFTTGEGAELYIVCLAWAKLATDSDGHCSPTFRMTSIECSQEANKSMPSILMIVMPWRHNVCDC